MDVKQQHKKQLQKFLYEKFNPPPIQKRRSCAQTFAKLSNILGHAFQLPFDVHAKWLHVDGLQFLRVGGRSRGAKSYSNIEVVL